MPHWMNQTTRRESRSPMLLSMPSTSHRANSTATGTISSNREHPAQRGNLFPYGALGTTLSSPFATDHASALHRHHAGEHSDPAANRDQQQHPHAGDDENRQRDVQNAFQ